MTRQADKFTQVVALFGLRELEWWELADFSRAQGWVGVPRRVGVGWLPGERQLVAYEQLEDNQQIIQMQVGFSEQASIDDMDGHTFCFTFDGVGGWC